MSQNGMRLYLTLHCSGTSRYFVTELADFEVWIGAYGMTHQSVNKCLLHALWARGSPSWCL